MRSNFYKDSENGLIWWIDNDHVGEFLFSFDKKKIYNLFADFPEALTPEEVKIFIKDQPYWRDFFIDRLLEYQERHNITVLKAQ